MATQIIDTARTVQAQTLDLVKKSQEAATEALTTWMQSLQPFVPERVSGAADLDPETAELVDVVFDFADSLLSVQRELAISVLRSAAGLLPATEDAPVAKAAKAPTKR